MEDKGQQLSLPFLAPLTQSSVHPPTAPVDLSAGVEHNPDIYCRVLNALLDNGELRIGQLRALLDRIGARNAPIGAYTDMAINRGDAIRSEDRLITTCRSETSRCGPRWGHGGLLGLLISRLAESRSTRSKSIQSSRAARFWSLGNRFAAWDMRILEAAKTGEASRLSRNECSQAVRST